MFWFEAVFENNHITYTHIFSVKRNQDIFNKLEECIKESNPEESINIRIIKIKAAKDAEKTNLINWPIWMKEAVCIYLKI